MQTWDRADEITVHNDKEIKGFFRDYRWLSNFYPCSVKLGGLVYPSSENAYQAMKFPKEYREKFVSIDATAAKKLGKKAKIIPAEWNAASEHLMVLIVASKFSQNADLRELLIQTKGKYLEETNWWGDTRWGVCNGKGDNKLGRILMHYRDYLL